jgi:orotidine-5'-phosphate decarboxylase
MTVSFAARFASVRARFGPLVWGLDPSAAVLDRWGLGDSSDGLDRFVDIALDVAVGSVGAVKPQSAFYERHGWRGIRALTRLVTDAGQAGVLVIVDAKRGDVGSTNDAYAQAYLGDGAPIPADALTVHPYLGLGAMDAFVTRAHEAGSCLFVVTRSSNPEGRSIQAAVDRQGRTVEENLLEEIAAINRGLAPGQIGPVGAVIAPLRLGDDLDLTSPEALYLAPGVGAQGATPADVAATFRSCPDRVLVSASRSLLDPGPETGRIRDGILALSTDLRERLDR